MTVKMLSLPARIQQELAARALRACMAAEAAMASLRAECKPLETASPQRVLALNTQNMDNAHRSLQLQIEACESFSLSATAAFKQLCDVIFCNSDAEKSIMELEHTGALHLNTQNSASSKAQLGDFAADELPDCASWKSRPSAPDDSFARSQGDGEAMAAGNAPVQLVTEAQDTLLWEPDTGVAYSRFPSPESDNDATTSREEIVERRLTDDHTDWSRHLNSHHDVKDTEDNSSQSGNDIAMSKIHEDSDASDLDLDLRCEISSLRENSILSTNSSQDQLDDGFQMQQSQSVNENTESALTCGISAKPTTSDFSEFNANLRDAEHEIHSKSPPCNVSDAQSGVSSHTATGSPPPASSSSRETAPDRCNSDCAVEWQPATPSFASTHASWTMAEVTCTQTPSSGASRFSWSSDLPLYPVLSLHPQPAKSACPSPARVLPLHGQELKPAVLSLIESQCEDLAVRKSQPLVERELGHSPPSPSYADEFSRCVEPTVPLTPSPYTLKMRSVFSRAGVARRPSCSGHSMPAPLQSSYGHSDGNLFSMATAVSLSSGYRQPSISAGWPCGSSAYVSVMEKQALQIVSEAPLITQFSVSPISSSISTSSLSWESPATSSNYSGVSDSSRREGSMSNYQKKLEILQEQFPRAHGSGFRGEPLGSWGTTRIGALVSNPVGNSCVQSACKIPWQTSHMSTTTTEVERHVGAAISGSGSTFEAQHTISATQGRPTGGGVGYTQGNVSDHSVCYGSLESDCRYDGIMQGSKISESQVSEAGVCSTSNRESRDVASRDSLNRKDSAQKSQSRPSEPITSWRWNDDQSLASKETEAPGPVSSSCRTSNAVAMVGAGTAGDCARGETTLRSPELSDSEDDDDDDSSSTEREWNNILISMQQRGKLP